MNTNNYLLLCIGLLIGACTQSKLDPSKFSKGVIQFEKTSHDFGKLNEHDSPVTHRFAFRNIGKESLFIKNVKASCGCTSPNWSKEALAPGDTGYIEATYSPRGHPGGFNKSLLVISNTADSSISLFIAGNVIEKIKTIEELYKDTIGNIRINSRYLDLGIVNNKEIITKEFKLFNAGEKTVEFGSIKKSPSHLKITFDPKILPSKKEGRLIIRFNPSTKNEVGNFGDEIMVNTNDQLSPVKSFFISGTNTEYFPPLTEKELSLAPKLITDKTIHDFGKIKKGTKITTKFYIKNEGKQDLKIRKLEPSCYCTTAKEEKTALKPQEKSFIEVTFDSQDLSLGPDTKTVKVYSNDPRNASVYLVISATVTE